HGTVTTLPVLRSPDLVEELHEEDGAPITFYADPVRLHVDEILEVRRGLERGLVVLVSDGVNRNVGREGEESRVREVGFLRGGVGAAHLLMQETRIPDFLVRGIVGVLVVGRGKAVPTQSGLFGVVQSPESGHLGPAVPL